MNGRKLSKAIVKVVDIACWDLHARMLKKPLHALLGTKREKVLRYGDVRGQQPGFSPGKYAASVASYLERTKLMATKLHFPGAVGTEQGIEFKTVLETLWQVRKAVGPDRTLAWDPYPGSAESATTSVDEAKEIIRLMDEWGYAWIEGPLPPVPFETQIPKYAELLKTGPKLRIQAEGPGSPIGDGTSFEVMKQWVEAGAVNQCSTDAYIAAGLTNALRMLEYARTHPPLVINLHWAWAPHAHLAMAYDEKVFPIAEFPMGEDVPKEYLSGPWLLAPDWPGIFKID
jgi:L-alanine-DL-glutamate epimerase-like enolase superfamily enzyme